MSKVRRRLFKILMLGSSGVGKTALLERYVNRKYRSDLKVRKLDWFRLPLFSSFNLIRLPLVQIFSRRKWKLE